MVVDVEDIDACTRHLVLASECVRWVEQLRAIITTLTCVAAHHPPYQARRLKRRLVYQCHTSNFESSLPAFLVGAGSDHYIAFGGWYGGDVSGHWSPLLDNALGTPVSDAE